MGSRNSKTSDADDYAQAAREALAAGREEAASMFFGMARDAERREAGDAEERANSRGSSRGSRQG